MSKTTMGQIVNDRSILSSERVSYKDYNRRCSVEKKNSGRESQGANRKVTLTTDSFRFNFESDEVRQLNPGKLKKKKLNIYID
jgi:hypothetical protein